MTQVIPCINIIGLGQMGVLFTKYACMYATKVICYDNSASQIDSFLERFHKADNPFDINEPKSISDTDKNKITVTNNIEDLWREKAILTIIATHKETHGDYSCQAMLNGSHVLVEKPIAPSLKEAQKMLAVSEKTNKKLFIELSLHHFPAFSKINDIVQNSSIGQIKKYSINRVACLPEGYDANISATFDLMVHDTDFCLQVFGKPHSINTISNSWRSGLSIWNYDDLTIEMKALLPISNPLSFEYDFTLTSITGNYLSFTSASPSKIKIFQNKKESNIKLNNTSPYRSILEEIIRSLSIPYIDFINHYLSIHKGLECQKIALNGI